MSLKHFHYFFIVISILLCGFVARWAFLNSHFLAWPSVAGIIGLVAYLVWFVRKNRAPRYIPVVAGAFLLSSLASTSAFACAVCFGESDKQTTAAISNSIGFMIGVTTLVLVGITYMIVRMIRSVR